MPTAIEIQEPEIQKELSAPATIYVRGPELAKTALPARTLFSDSLLESGAPERTRRSLATTVSVVLQCIVVGVMLIVPLMFTEALPTQQLLTFLVAPPPPPPPPPPAAAIVRVVQTDVLNNGQLRTPTRIPQKVEMIREEEAPLPTNGGVVGGIPGGSPVASSAESLEESSVPLRVSLPFPS